MPYADKERQREAQRRYDAKRKGQRHRGWVFVMYPESMAEDWREKLTNEGLPCYVSPLHDKDVNADGKPKKPHYHVLLLWSTPNTYDNSRPIADSVGGVMPPRNPMPGQPKPWAQDIRRAARYLCHLDNPEKAQYSPEDVTCVNATMYDYLELIANGADDDAALDEMFDFIDEQGIISFATFVRYCRQERPEWRRLVYHKYAAIVTRYIKSVAWEGLRQQDEEEQDEREERRRIQQAADLSAMSHATNALEFMAQRMRQRDM